MKKEIEYYKKDYFDWQKNIGYFGGIANLKKFESYIGENDKVIDFGCGGGYLLNNVSCKEKIGVEINEVARANAAELGIKAVEDLNNIDDGWADIIISNNALEHTTNPFEEIKKVYKKLNHGGKAIFVVPCDSINYEYDPNDINKHLYSWSPMNLGNIFSEAGFYVKESRPYIHKWPRHYDKIARVFGLKIFHLICRIYGNIDRKWFQVRIVAIKK